MYEKDVGTDGHTISAKIVITTGRECGSASWITKKSNFSISVTRRKFFPGRFSFMRIKNLTLFWISVQYQFFSYIILLAVKMVVMSVQTFNCSFK